MASLQTATMMGARDLSAIPVAASLSEFSKVETDYGTAFSPFESFINEVLHPTSFKKGKTLLNVFALVYDDNAVLEEKYHTLLGDTEQRCESWRSTNDGVPYRGQRLYQCTVSVKAMMGKLRPYDEYQRYAFLRVSDVPTLIVQSSSHVSGVMFSDSFRPEVLTVFTQSGVGDDAVVTMRSYAYVQFIKSVWIKGKITSTAIGEIRDGRRQMAELIRNALDKNIACDEQLVSSTSMKDLLERVEQAPLVSPVASTCTSSIDEAVVHEVDSLSSSHLVAPERVAFTICSLLFAMIVVCVTARAYVQLLYLRIPATADMSPINRSPPDISPVYILDRHTEDVLARMLRPLLLATYLGFIIYFTRICIVCCAAFTPSSEGILSWKVDKAPCFLFCG